MSIPHMLYAGATSADPDFITVVSTKQQLLADARITRWFAARPSDVTLDPDAPTKIAAMIDRKGLGNGSALADDALKPVLAASAAFGGRTAAQFTGGADRSIAIPGLDLTGSTFFVAALVRRGAVDATNGDTIFWHGAGSQEVRMSAAASGNFFQFFGRGGGLNIASGNAAPDTAPKLVIGSFDGTNIKGALGSAGAVVSAAGSGAAVAAGSPAFLARRATAPITYFGGDIAQIIIGNVDLLAAAQADLRALIAQYLGEYYGVAL